jgi:SEC-C motif-containing protein
MRSRYAAYAKGLVSYVLATSGEPTTSDVETRRMEVAAFSAQATFEGLAILEVEPNEAVAYVTFRAQLSMGGRDASFTERSRFERVGERWLYVAGERRSA